MSTLKDHKGSKTKGLQLKGTGKVGEGSGAIAFPNVSTAPNPTDGRMLYVEDSLLKYWDGSSATTLGAAGAVSNFSLNDAYDDGSSVTVDNGAVVLAGVDEDTAVLSITGDGDSAGALISFAHTTNTRNDLLGTGSTWKITGQGAATLTAIDMQDNELITFGTGNDATIGWNGTLLNIAGAVDFDDAVTTQSTLTVAGSAGSNSFTLTAGDVVISDGSIALTDADNAESVTIINNTATTIGAAATAGVVQIESTSLTTGAAVNVQLTEGTLNGGFYYSAWDATAGARVFSVAEDGAVTIAGAGGSNVLTVSAGDVVMSDGSLTITDADNAASVAVTNNTATTIGASASTGVANLVSTSLTTGTLLNLELTEGTLNGGWYVRAWDATGAAAVFSVGENGLTTIAGSASGTDALVLTAGDILVTSGHVDMTVGDLTLADGAVLVTDADNAASLTVTNNTITTADALVDLASTSLTTGAMLRINANTDAHDGEVLELISSGDTTSTPTGLSVTIAEPTTGAAHGINVTMVGATTGPTGIKVTMDAITEGDMLYLDNGGGTLTTGYFINCNDDDSTLFGVGANGVTTIAGAGGSAALTVTAGDIVFSDGSIALTDADNAESVTIINNTASTIGAAASAGIVQVESTSLTTGAAVNVQLTEGTLNGGFYYSGWDATAGARVFSVGEDGATTIAGSAGLTAALTLTKGDLVMSEGLIQNGTNAGVTADVGSAQGGGAIIDAVTEIATVGTTGDSVTLPAAAAGRIVYIINHGANAADVFPASGDAINEGSADAAVAIAANETLLCIAYDSGNWEALTMART